MRQVIQQLIGTRCNLRVMAVQIVCQQRKSQVTLAF